MTRRRPVLDRSPVHVVFDNEALGQVGRGRLSRQLLVSLEFAERSGAHIVVPTSVVVESDHHVTAAAAAGANRLLREAQHDQLTDARAADAVGLRVRSGEHGSVVDAHVAAAALAVVRRHGGIAMVATSDPSDITRLLDGSTEAAVRAAADVLPL